MVAPIFAPGPIWVLPMPVQYDDELKAYYERMRARGKHYNVALCATATRLLERTYDILAEGREQETESQDQLIGTG